MAFYDRLKDRMEFLKRLTPSYAKKLANERLSDLTLSEANRSKKRIEDLMQRYPSAGKRELCQHVIDAKKSLAGVVGGVTGVFGVVTLPVDLSVMVWLELQLLTDIATIYKANLKAEAGRDELLDLFGYASGVGPLARSGPRVVGSVAGALLKKAGLQVLGRAAPLVAAPLSAYLNNQHIQKVGDEAIRHYDGFGKAHEKSRRVGDR